MIIINYIPIKQEGITNMYLINGEDKNNEIIESNPSGQEREKEFEKAFPKGLELLPAIKKQLIRRINIDSSFLTKFGVFKYYLVIFIEKTKETVTSEFFWSNYDKRFNYKTGVVFD